MNKKVRVKEVVMFASNNLSASGVVTLTFKADYSDLTNTMQAMQLLNNDITVRAKVGGRPALALGTYRIKSIGVKGDGCSTIKLSGITDYVEMDNINKLPLMSDDNSRFIIALDTEIECEEDND